MNAETAMLLKSIEPKSDQLNAEDLLTGPVTVTVDAVHIGEGDQQPVTIGISGHKPYKPCKTMRRLLVVLWGSNAVAWIGRQLTLFCDREVKWGGQNVGGIRISHMSHIDEPKTMMLSESKGKRKPVTVYPLEVVNASTLLDEWRPKFDGAPDEVLKVAKDIAAAWSDKVAEYVVDVAPEAILALDDTDQEWRIVLESFRQSVAADLLSE
jgi:hypothetical protein